MSLERNKEGNMERSRQTNTAQILLQKKRRNHEVRCGACLKEEREKEQISTNPEKSKRKKTRKKRKNKEK